MSGLGSGGVKRWTREERTTLFNINTQYADVTEEQMYDIMGRVHGDAWRKENRTFTKLAQIRDEWRSRWCLGKSPQWDQIDTHVPSPEQQTLNSKAVAAITTAAKGTTGLNYLTGRSNTTSIVLVPREPAYVSTGRPQRTPGAPRPRKRAASDVNDDSDKDQLSSHNHRDLANPQQTPPKQKQKTIKRPRLSSPRIKEKNIPTGDKQGTADSKLQIAKRVVSCPASQFQELEDTSEPTVVGTQSMQPSRVSVLRCEPFSTSSSTWNGGNMVRRGYINNQQDGTAPPLEMVHRSFIKNEGVGHGPTFRIQQAAHGYVGKATKIYRLGGEVMRFHNGTASGEQFDAMTCPGADNGCKFCIRCDTSNLKGSRAEIIQRKQDDENDIDISIEDSPWQGLPYVHLTDLFTADHLFFEPGKCKVLKDEDYDVDGIVFNDTHNFPDGTGGCLGKRSAATCGEDCKKCPLTWQHVLERTSGTPDGRAGSQTESKVRSQDTRTSAPGAPILEVSSVRPTTMRCELPAGFKYEAPPLQMVHRCYIRNADQPFPLGPVFNVLDSPQGIVDQSSEIYSLGGEVMRFGNSVGLGHKFDAMTCPGAEHGCKFCGRYDPAVRQNGPGWEKQKALDENDVDIAKAIEAVPSDGLPFVHLLDVYSDVHLVYLPGAQKFLEDNVTTDGIYFDDTNNMLGKGGCMDKRAAVMCGAGCKRCEDIVSSAGEEENEHDGLN